MDVSSIAGAAALMQSSQTQQALSASMIKMNAESQSKIAEMIQKGTQSMPQPTQGSVSGFFTYA
jgi:hypothetical protein